MSATNVQGGNLRTRSTRQTGRGQDPPRSSSDSLNRDVSRPGIPPRVVDSHHQHALSVDFPIQMHREIGRLHPREDPARSVDKVFNVYGERLRADLRDMHGLCSQLVAQEKQEAAKWYGLCAKVIVERDHARQRLNLLAHERNNVASSSSLAEAQNTDFACRLASKRSREVPPITQESKLDSDPARSAIENRPMRSLRLSLVHSPPASPSPGLSTSPPSSSRLTMTPPLSAATTPAYSEPSPFEQRPVKLRRSCDMSHYVSYQSNSQAPPSTPPSSPHVKIKQQSRTPSPLPPPTGILASNFSHVDLMYVSAKGAFVCRACLLEKSKLSSFEPKAFPLTASWDELRDHCVIAHPEACADVARLQPAEIFELRRRLGH